jgi:hypothetical protein
MDRSLAHAAAVPGSADGAAAGIKRHRHHLGEHVVPSGCAGSTRQIGQQLHEGSAAGRLGEREAGRQPARGVLDCRVVRRHFCGFHQPLGGGGGGGGFAVRCGLRTAELALDLQVR